MATLFGDHNIRIRTIESRGYELPAVYTELRARYDEYRKLQTPKLDELINALVDGSDVDLADLRAKAAGEQHAREVDDAVRAALAGRLLDAYAEHAAQDVYRQVQRDFNDTAAAFTRAADAIDVEMDPAEVLDADVKAQAQWKAAGDLAARLTELLEPLTAAAYLAGVELPTKGLPAASTDRRLAEDQLELGLTVNSEGVHIRRLWEGWSAEGRCAPWSGVHKLAEIRAVDLADYQPTRRPKQLMERRSTDGTVTVYDPEDGELPERPSDDSTGAWKPASVPQPVAFPQVR